MLRLDDGVVDEQAGTLLERVQWLWFKPPEHNLAEDGDDVIEMLEEEGDLPEEQAHLRNSSFQKTASWAVPKEVSSSGRVYQSAQLSQLEYSKPTMSIRSRVCSWSSSPRPLQQRPVRSLTNLTLMGSSPNSRPLLTDSRSLKMDEESGERNKLGATNGTTLLRTNSRSTSKGTPPRGRRSEGSASPFKLLHRALNR
ncbi:TPA_asm: P4 protein [Piper methysticum polerovirus]|uniref:P4 protein n=1 Tax=Piper methysticum polerovirus TaxID=2885088 RepID=A0AAD2QG04_9VIRU|nr:TPA_asm: P4 protein [Piper methysticum polerovirus]